jgi:hypothetical protein
MLRQFAGLLLLLLVSLAAWRIWRGQFDAWAWTLGGLGLGLGGLGLIVPSVVRPVFTTWMVVAFPIGWTVSRVMLAALFYLLFTPVGLLFRVIRRDPLRLSKPESSSFWTPKTGAADAKQYFRQF